MFSEQLAHKICQHLQQTQIVKVTQFKSLWSHFGALYRVRFADNTKPLVIKAITQPTNVAHPKGWNSDFATQRKLRSYQVENAFYKYYSQVLPNATPHYFGTINHNNSQYLLLEDLADSGFDEISPHCIESVKLCLSWLAQLHAKFLDKAPQHLWQQGNYWHLATRTDEFNALTDTRLKEHASVFDSALRASPYQTIIHGDAKIANFMINKSKVNAIDFQYAGKGVGIIDVILLLSSAFSSDELYLYESTLLNHYKSELIMQFGLLNIANGNQIAHTWLALYDCAWADFVRFLAGWSPNHWKLHPYALEKVNKVLTPNSL